MTYKLKVLRSDENPNYSTELEKWQNDTRYRNFNNEPQPAQVTITNAIEVELTDEQFEAVKLAVIKTFK